MISLKITPDSRLDNKNVDELAKALYQYKSPLERMHKGKLLPPNFLSFETVLEKENTSFYLTIPSENESIAKKTLTTIFPKSALEKAEDPFNDEPVLCNALNYERHFMFSLKVDKRKMGALPSLLETIKVLEEGEKVYIQSISTPAHPEWHQGAVEAYEKFKNGEMPRKKKLSKQTISNATLKAITHTVYGTASLLAETIGGEGLEPLKLDGSELAVLMRDGGLSTSTLNKMKAGAYETEIRVAVVCSDIKKAENIMRMATSSFRSLDGDNMLIASNKNEKKLFAKMKNRKLTNILNNDYFSIDEVSRLHLLPTKEYQEQYHIPNIAQLEVEVNSVFTKEEGIFYGEVPYKQITKPIYLPTNNHDILCLPRIVIGGMGSGKTRGMASNFIVESIRNGFGSLAIDPAKGEILEEIKSKLEPSQIISIKLGKTPIALDWREVNHSEKSRNRLANTILGFFASAELEAGGQTARYIRAAVMGMQTGRLSEIIRIFEDENYRTDCINKMKESIHKSTLEQYSKQSEAKQSQILAPILNRLDTILGDEYLSECMDAEEGLDLVELMSQKKAVIIDVPKTELGAEAVDLIVNLLTTKIDLAMTLRKEQFPFFVLLDEPHQFLRSAKTWKSAAVESRKWRVGYVWLFHSWEQIPKDLSEIIKAAGPHYTIYNSSKKTFSDLAEEIKPFTIEDGINLKRFHAINILRTEEGVAKPFIAKIAQPPSMQKMRDQNEERPH